MRRMGVGNATFMVLMFVVMAEGEKAFALEYNVGDRTGWIVGPINYTTWAASNQFHVGDTIVFSYNKQFHNVLEVTKGNYDKCSSATPLASYNDGNTTVLLKNAGSHYYICGFPGHCVAGQKVKITVLAASGPSPAPNAAMSKVPGLSPPVAAAKGNSNTFPSVPLHQVSAALLAGLMWALVVFHLL